ncbi:MAG: NUDIX hydrolase [Planctomycetota bacterium]
MERKLLAADHASLAPRDDLAYAVEHLGSYRPTAEEQARERDRILAFCAEHSDALHRSCLAGHLTAGALLLDHRGERALLTLHAKLGKWLQLGGHADGDANLPAVALREVTEESGIEGCVIDPRPIDVDVHVIPTYRDVPEHLHLDTTYVCFAPEGAVPVVSHESTELAWLGYDDVERLNPERSLLRAYRAAGLGPQS